MVNTNVCHTNFIVDIQIRDNDKDCNYSLGILLHGYGYHKTQTTRDREIVQPTVLKMLNWRIMRVWSVDWLVNPKRVLSRIESHLKENQSAIGPIEQSFFDLSKEEVVKIENNLRDYVTYVNNKDVNSMTDTQLIHEIIACEQPMTLMYLCRRFCTFRGIPRVTPTMLSAVTNIVNTSLYKQQIGSTITVWKTKGDADSFMGYRKNNGRDIAEIPLIEVMNAIKDSVKEQFSIKTDVLTLIAAKQLGFTRRGTKVDQTIKEALGILISEHQIIEKEGMLRLAE